MEKYQGCKFRSVGVKIVQSVNRDGFLESKEVEDFRPTKGYLKWTCKKNISEKEIEIKLVLYRIKECEKNGQEVDEWDFKELECLMNEYNKLMVQLSIYENG